MLQKFGQETTGVIAEKIKINLTQESNIAGMMRKMMSMYYQDGPTSRKALENYAFSPMADAKKCIYYLKYRFQVKNKNYTGKSEIPTDFYYEYKEGNSVAVTYWPSDPANNRLTNIHINQAWFATSAKIIFIIAILVITICYVGLILNGQYGRHNVFLESGTHWQERYLWWMALQKE